jgi:hypothetical protein
MLSVRDAEGPQRTFATPQRERKRLRYRTFKYVTDDFGNQLAIKVCSGCFRWLEYFEYPNIDKTTGRPKGLCYSCKREYEAEWREARREEQRAYSRELRQKHLADPLLRELLLERERKSRQRRTAEQKRRYARQHYYRIKQDPKKYAEYLEMRRLQGHMRRERAGKKRVPSRGVKQLKFPQSGKPIFAPNDKEKFPIGPISEWVEEKVKQVGSKYELAKICGVDEKQIRRIAERGGDEVSFALVDQMLTAEGSIFIWDLYPDEYEKLVDAA